MGALARVRDGKDLVAVILAIGIATALNIIIIAVLYDAIASKHGGLSENATQILTGAFGGILGILGSYIGYRAGMSASVDQNGTGAVRSPQSPDAPSGTEPEHPETPSAPS